jgi:hypothetical protein
MEFSHVWIFGEWLLFIKQNAPEFLQARYFMDDSYQTTPKCEKLRPTHRNLYSSKDDFVICCQEEISQNDSRVGRGFSSPSCLRSFFWFVL